MSINISFPNRTIPLTLSLKSSCSYPFGIIPKVGKKKMKNVKIKKKEEVNKEIRNNYIVNPRGHP
jgi:hypothetical protein